MCVACGCVSVCVYLCSGGFVLVLTWFVFNVIVVCALRLCLFWLVWLLPVRFCFVVLGAVAFSVM